jgi:hypothetical protein
MARPDAVRRVKSYSAADGFVYQYYFFEGKRAQRGGTPGGEFTYVVSVDRQTAFPFKIFVEQSALEAWAGQNGRPLSSSEEYAVAKMRLFRAFDDGVVQANPQGQPPREVVVNAANLEDLLGQLGIKLARVRRALHSVNQIRHRGVLWLTKLFAFSGA